MMNGLQLEGALWTGTKRSRIGLRPARRRIRRSTCRASSARRGSRPPSPRTAACPTCRSTGTGMRGPPRRSKRRSGRLPAGRGRRSSIGSRTRLPAPSRPGGASGSVSTRNAWTISGPTGSKPRKAAWRFRSATPSTSSRPTPSCRPTPCGGTRRAGPRRSCCARTRRTAHGDTSTSRRCCATRAASGSTTPASRSTAPSAWTGSASRSPTSNRSARTSTTRRRWSACSTRRSRSSSSGSSRMRPTRSSTTTTSSTRTTRATARRTRTPRTRGSAPGTSTSCTTT